ncbi:hypothetical protein [Haloferax sulfurifontis]|uniref:DUF8115 domain-containing protein n=2 Tax=Haloferax sulfurifontis TaxID=255616 RepID=M0IMF6_9EURY|nr:hypothetical protein [Haloferax sulfurifontis]ELZ96649.1 hypothetical protein C441_04754 [Haloferax sulfurifontis ATCC BAA-897]GGC72253.1 hypothetical protein GCM10007209_37720 [Haloferax sulfurifontis]
MSDDQSKAEELLQSKKSEKRHTSQPARKTAAGDGPDLASAVEAAYHDIDEGDIIETLSIRDGNLAALFAALETTGELEDVGRRALGRLDRDGDADSKAQVLKALIRIGLSDVASDELAAATEGKRRFKRSQIEDDGF